MITFEAINLQNRDHYNYLKGVIKCVLCEDTKGIVAIRDGQVVAAMVADSWAHNSCQVHVGVSDPLALKHGLHKEFANWVFNVCGRGMIIGLTPSNNKKARKLNKHFGFKEIFIIPDGFDKGIDYVVTQIKREDCKYLTNISEVA